MTPQAAATALILTAARAWIGTPWRARTALRGQGADCTGLVRGVLRDVIGQDVPPPPWDPPGACNGAAILAAGKARLLPVAPDQARPGHVVAYRIGRRRVAHVGILTGGGRVLHCCERSGTVETPGPLPWPITAAWAFPAADDCGAGRADLDPDDLLAVVYDTADGGAFAEITDQLTGEPLGRTGAFASPLAALDYLAPWNIEIERV